jgi:hypothetical protein
VRHRNQVASVTLTGSRVPEWEGKDAKIASGGSLATLASLAAFLPPE